jgi:hypothetical protein
MANPIAAARFKTSFPKCFFLTLNGDLKIEAAHYLRIRTA